MIQSVNSYPTAECDYQIEQTIFYFNYSSNGGDRIKLFKQWQPNNHIQKWQLDDSSQMKVMKQWHLNHCNQIKLLD
jgi:hypothetical protein